MTKVGRIFACDLWGIISCQNVRRVDENIRILIAGSDNKSHLKCGWQTFSIMFVSSRKYKEMMQDYDELITSSIGTCYIYFHVEIQWNDYNW